MAWRDNLLIIPSFRCLVLGRRKFVRAFAKDREWGTGGGGDGVLEFLGLSGKWMNICLWFCVLGGNRSCGSSRKKPEGIKDDDLVCCC